MDKAVKQLVRRLRHAGFEVTQGSAHFKVKQNGKVVAILPLSPSDHRWKKNFDAAMRQRRKK